MKAMDKAKQAAVIAEKQKERNEINKRIDELSKLRKKELDAREAAAAKEGKADGFDVAAKKALRKSVKANAAVRPRPLRSGAMNTNWRFRDHRGFQHDAVVVIGAAAAVGGAGVGAAARGRDGVDDDGGRSAAGAAGGAGRRAGAAAARWSRSMTSALGAVLAGATWRAFAGERRRRWRPGDALLVGLLAGLAASSALVIAHVERVADRPLARALVEARATLGGPASRSGRWRSGRRSRTTGSSTGWAATGGAGRAAAGAAGRGGDARGARARRALPQAARASSSASTSAPCASAPAR